MWQGSALAHDHMQNPYTVLLVCTQTKAGCTRRSFVLTQRERYRAQRLTAWQRLSDIPSSEVPRLCFHVSCPSRSLAEMDETLRRIHLLSVHQWYCSVVSSDHWGLNAVQLCGMIHKIAFSEANRCLSLSFFLCCRDRDGHSGGHSWTGMDSVS